MIDEYFEVPDEFLKSLSDSLSSCDHEDSEHMGELLCIESIPLFRSHTCEFVITINIITYDVFDLRIIKKILI